MTAVYNNLEIFHLAYKFVIKIYPCVDKFPENEQKNLILQIKRSAVSIPLNIAEGSSRRTDRQFLPFLGYTFGSAKELEVSLKLSRDLGFVSAADYEILSEDLQRLVAKLAALMRHMEQKLPGKKEVVMGAIVRGENPLVES